MKYHYLHPAVQVTALIVLYLIVANINDWWPVR